jgi:hypothetical protein
MKNYLVELTFFLFGLYLLLQSQYITLLILLFLSLILVSKGIQYKSSLLIPLVIILFITEYHRYFPYRQEIDNNKLNNANDIEDNSNDDNDNEFIEIEGFKTNQEDIKMKKIKKEVRKRAKSRKKVEKRLEKEIKKNNAGMPKRYINNQVKIKKKSNNLSEAWDKWGLIKENLFIILNSD